MPSPLIRSGFASILSTVLTIGTEVTLFFADISTAVSQVLPILLELSGTGRFILLRWLTVLTNGLLVHLRILPISSIIPIVLAEVAA